MRGIPVCTHKHALTLLHALPQVNIHYAGSVHAQYKCSCISIGHVWLGTKLWMPAFIGYLYTTVCMHELPTWFYFWECLTCKPFKGLLNNTSLYLCSVLLLSPSSPLVFPLSRQLGSQQTALFNLTLIQPTILNRAFRGLIVCQCNRERKKTW